MSCLRKSAILLLLVAGVFSCLAAGPQRIAVVDLERVFREYYKSRIAEEMIRKQAKAYRDYLLRLNNELKQLAAEAQSARSNALNIALDPAEKQKVENVAAAKNEAFRAKEAEIKLFVNERSADMRKRGAVKKEQRWAWWWASGRTEPSAGRTYNDW